MSRIYINASAYKVCFWFIVVYTLLLENDISAKKWVCSYRISSTHVIYGEFGCSILCSNIGEYLVQPRISHTFISPCRFYKLSQNISSFAGYFLPYFCWSYLSYFRPGILKLTENSDGLCIVRNTAQMGAAAGYGDAPGKGKGWSHKFTGSRKRYTDINLKRKDCIGLSNQNSKRLLKI